MKDWDATFGEEELVDLVLSVASSRMTRQELIEIFASRCEPLETNSMVRRTSREKVAKPFSWGARIWPPGSLLSNSGAQCRQRRPRPSGYRSPSVLTCTRRRVYNFIHAGHMVDEKQIRWVGSAYDDLLAF